MDRKNPLSDEIRAEALRLGFQAVGITPVRPSDHSSLYRSWLERGLHGTMEYLERPDAVEARFQPTSRWAWARSAVVVAEPYLTADEDLQATSGDPRTASAGAAAGEGVRPEPAESSPAHGIIARYARGRDYHRVLKKKLLALLRFIEERTGEELAVARAYVDTGPVLERELARRAGIGWFGRNTMLIDPKGGSYFFLGSLLLPFDLGYDEPFEADRCGTCNACVEACPTGALLGRDENGAPVIDATRCISYLTIENRGEIPQELRPAIGNRIYGCDICQEVCPWNSEKLVTLTHERDYRLDWRAAEDRPEAPADLPGTESPSLVGLMRMSRGEWDRWTRGSAIRRAGYAGLKRNVAVALGNWGSKEAVPALIEALDNDEPLVRSHAAWALGRIGSDQARGRLAIALGEECDASVRQELQAALRRCA